MRGERGERQNGGFHVDGKLGHGQVLNLPVFLDGNPKRRRSALTGETVPLKVTDLSTDGRGVAHHEGRAYFVDRALPGDIVRAKLIHETWPFSAQVIEFLSKSEHRCDHPCPHADLCPGSLWGGLVYSQQLLLKRNLVARTLARQIGEADVQPMLPSPEIWNYRSRISLTVWREHDHLQAGFQTGPRAETGFPIETCSLCVSCIQQVIREVADFFRRLRLTPDSAVPRRGLLYETAVGAGMTLVFPKALSKSEQMEWKARFRELKLPGGCWLATGTRAGVLRERSDWHRLGEALPMLTRWLDQHVELHPSAFCQANAAAATLVARQLRDWAGEYHWKRVWDLYGGFGGLGMAAANKDASVWVYELNARVEPALRSLAASLNLSAVAFVSGDLLRVFPRRMREIGEHDAIILDPPRSGAHPRILEVVGRSRASTVIYLSCNPARLARDLGLLLPHGFKPDLIQPVDFFPQTPAIETLALLRR